MNIDVIEEWQLCSASKAPLQVCHENCYYTEAYNELNNWKKKKRWRKK